MIFSSNIFIFVFLPPALIGYYLIARFGVMAANAWLALASLAFYSYWNPAALVILAGSITWNYAIGLLLARVDDRHGAARLGVLWTGIVANLALLVFYKYLFPILGFLAIHAVVPQGWAGSVIMPLGISFFTFTQIGFLVDSYDRSTQSHDPVSYIVFVTFFPHLIAGPILHNREILPQLTDPATKVLRAENLSVGFSIFALGMAKKVLIADPLGRTVDFGFDNIGLLGTGNAWISACSYSLQLYFDFSGYSDMAVGIARMFGIIFPVNFNSPYKARSIIDFWARWHMTLTRYLTLYIYNPIALRLNRRRVARGLSTSRKGTRNVPAFLSLIVMPTFVTMGLAGAWHGAGLQFVAYGVLHATFLSINHAWRIFGNEQHKPTVFSTVGSMFLTYGAVLFAEVFFRAASLGEAFSLLAAMAGMHHGAPLMMPSTVTTSVLRIGVAYLICFFLPNTQQFMRDFRPIYEKVAPISGMVLTWKPSVPWALAIGALLVLAMLNMSDVSKFLYFQF